MSHRPSLKSWSAQILDPDGETGPFRVRAAVGVASAVPVCVALTLLVVREWREVAVLLALLGLAIAWARVFLTRGRAVLGAHLLLRVATVVAVTLFYASEQPAERGVVWVAGSILVLLTTVEPLLRRLRLAAVFFSSRMPGLQETGPARLDASLVPNASAAAAVVGAVCSLGDDLSVVWLVVTILVALLFVLILLDGASRLRRSEQAKSSLRRAVADYAPEFIVYAGRPDDASYQVTMWLPYLERSGRRFLVVTRRDTPARALAALTDAPVLSCRSVAELEAVMAPSLSTVFYVNASSANGQMVRYQQLTHVYLGHGDSDKAPSYNPTHAMFDHIFAAGEAAIDRYAAHGVHIPRTRFMVVGRPQVEGVERASGPIAEVEDPTVLYAPTWRGHVDETQLHSLPHGATIVTGLLARGCTVIFRPHPFSYTYPQDAALIAGIHALLEQDATATGRAHVWGQAAEDRLSIFDCFNASDAMVSDVSSVVSDYLYSGKPFAMYSIGDPDQFVTEFPVARAAHLLTPDVSNLDGVLEELLDTDSSAATRLAVRTAYLGDFPHESYSDVFVDAVNTVVAAGHHATQSEPAEETGGRDDDAATPDDGEGDDGRDGGDGGEGADGSEPAGPQRSGQSRPRRAVGTLRRLQVVAVLPLLTSVLAVMTASIGSDRLLPIALAGLSLGWVTWAAAPRLLRPVPGALGRYVPTRLLVAVTVCTLASSTDDARSHRLLAGLAMLTLLAALVLEMWSAEGMTAQRLRVSNLPGFDAHEVSTRITGWTLPASLVALWAGLALSLVDRAVRAYPGAVTGWVAALLAVAALLVSVATLYAVVRRVRASRAAAEELPAAVAAYQPQFVVYFASPAGASYQLGMWMPLFEQLDRRFVVVTRFAATVRSIVALTDAPVILCRTLRSLEEIIAPSLTTVFYVNNGVKNTHFIEHRELTHIWLNHGDSEKPACYNPVHVIYDRIFSAGQAGIDRYARHGVDIERRKFEIVGRPQVRSVQVATRTVPELLAAGESPTVLYAPTWVGPYADSRLYSLPVGADIVRALLDRGCTVVFRAHPLNYRFPTARRLIRDICALLREDAAATGRAHLWGSAAERRMSVEDCFNASDAMISDVSAVVTDYLQAQKPFSMVAVGATHEQLIDVAPVAAASYILDEDLGNLTAMLEALLGADPLAQRRAAMRRYYLGDFDDADPAEPFLRAARRHIDRQDQLQPAHELSAH